MSEETIVRLLRHMAWANEKLFIQLSELPEGALSASAWNPEWTVGKIANHIVVSQGRLISRLKEVEAPSETETPFTSEGMKSLASLSMQNDANLLDFAEIAEKPLTFVRYGKTVQFLSTTVLAQSIHHATEHRAQIADILAFNKMDVINLDSLDLWSFERANVNGN